MADPMQQAREQFEAWATSQHLPIKRHRWGEYKVDDTETAWEAWQAALRAAAPGIDLQWLVEGLDEIGSLSRNLRQGGCDAGDLEGLENGLMHAVDMAHQLRDRLLAMIDASSEGGSNAASA